MPGLVIRNFVLNASEAVGISMNKQSVRCNGVPNVLVINGVKAHVHDLITVTDPDRVEGRFELG